MRANLISHPKFHAFRQYLRQDIPRAIGLLELFWLQLNIQGSPLVPTAEALAGGCFWEGEPARLLGALLLAGFAEEVDGAILAHDWESHAPRWARQLWAKRRRQIQRQPVHEVSDEVAQTGLFGFLREHGPITARQLHRAEKARFPSPEAAERWLNDLARRHLGRWLPFQSTARGGRPSRKFMLHTPGSNDSGEAVPLVPKRTDTVPQPAETSESPRRSTQQKSHLNFDGERSCGQVGPPDAVTPASVTPVSCGLVSLSFQERDQAKPLARIGCSEPFADANSSRAPASMPQHSTPHPPPKSEEVLLEVPSRDVNTPHLQFTRKHLQFLCKRFHASESDMLAYVRSAHSWITADPERRKRYPRGMLRFFSRWVESAINRGKFRRTAETTTCTALGQATPPSKSVSQSTSAQPQPALEQQASRKRSPESRITWEQASELQKLAHRSGEDGISFLRRHAKGSVCLLAPDRYELIKAHLEQLAATAEMARQHLREARGLRRPSTD